MPKPGISTPNGTLVTCIREYGFSCQRCGVCCTEVEPGSNQVMVGPEEIYRIMEGSGLSFEEIVEPYPERIRESGKDYTFGWVIRQKKGQCMFLSEKHCTIYSFRPWICRTYPFMLEDGTLTVHPCLGLQALTETKEAGDLVLDLLKRQEFELQEEEKIRTILRTKTIPTGIPVVIDGEGIKIYHG